MLLHKQKFKVDSPVYYIVKHTS